jgi:hypothetical protein
VLPKAMALGLMRGLAAAALAGAGAALTGCATSGSSFVPAAAAPGPHALALTDAYQDKPAQFDPGPRPEERQGVPAIVPHGGPSSAVSSSPGAAAPRTLSMFWKPLLDYLARAEARLPAAEKEAALWGIFAGRATPIAPSRRPTRIQAADGTIELTSQLVSCRREEVPYWARGRCGRADELVHAVLLFEPIEADPLHCFTNADVRRTLLSAGWTESPSSGPKAIGMERGVVRVVPDAGMRIEDVLNEGNKVVVRLRPSADLPPGCRFEFSVVL